MDNRYGHLEALQVSILIEDYAGYDVGFLSQHGVSFLLEARHKKGSQTLLFDVGQSAPPVLQNMKALGFGPNNIDLVFLTHCHFDHTGGLVGILEASERKRIPVIAHPTIHRPHFSLKPVFRPVGMGPGSSPEAIERAGGEMVLTADPLPLMPGMLTTGEIIKRVEIEKAPTLSLLTLEDGKIVPDFMADDISLVCILPQGLVIITGCSHAGIISIINKTIKLTGIDKLVAVIGGFHLVDAEEGRVDETVEYLAAMDVDKIYTGHCTGFKAEAKMLMVMNKRFRKLHTGMKINF